MTDDATCMQTIKELYTPPSEVKIVAVTDSGNARSKALLQKPNFQQTSQMGQDVFKKGPKRHPNQII